MPNYLSIYYIKLSISAILHHLQIISNTRVKFHKNFMPISNR